MGAGAEQFGNAAGQTFEIHGGQIELQRPCFETGIVQKVVDEAQQVLRRFLGRLGIGALGSVKTCAR